MHAAAIHQADDNRTLSHKALAEHGMYPTDPADESTLFCVAPEEGDVEIPHIIIDHDLDETAPEDDGGTSPHESLSSGHAEAAHSAASVDGHGTDTTTVRTEQGSRPYYYDLVIVVFCPFF